DSGDSNSRVAPAGARREPHHRGVRARVLGPSLVRLPFPRDYLVRHRPTDPALRNLRLCTRWRYPRHSILRSYLELACVHLPRRSVCWGSALRYVFSHETLLERWAVSVTNGESAASAEPPP